MCFGAATHLGRAGQMNCSPALSTCVVAPTLLRSLSYFLEYVKLYRHLCFMNRIPLPNVLQLQMFKNLPKDLGKGDRNGQIHAASHDVRRNPLWVLERNARCPHTTCSTIQRSCSVSSPGAGLRRPMSLLCLRSHCLHQPSYPLPSSFCL